MLKIFYQSLNSNSEKDKTKLQRKMCPSNEILKTFTSFKRNLNLNQNTNERKEILFCSFHIIIKLVMEIVFLSFLFFLSFRQEEKFWTSPLIFDSTTNCLIITNSRNEKVFFFFCKNNIRKFCPTVEQHLE